MSNGGSRRHQVASVGDRFGDRTVTALVQRGHRGRSDERVMWRCVCGVEGVSWVFNLRGGCWCRHVKVCACSHHRDDHRPRNGSCLDDDCECEGFTKP